MRQRCRGRGLGSGVDVRRQPDGTVDQISIIEDHRDRPAPILTFGAFGTGIEDRPSVNASALDGTMALVFVHESPDAPGQLVAAIEGLWLQCRRRAASLGYGDSWA